MPKPFSRAEIRAILGDVHTDEIENALITLHRGVVDLLKDDVAKYKADADKLPGVQQKLDALEAAGDGGYKKKYEDEHSAFEQYKQQIADEKSLAVVKTAYRKMLEDGGIDPSRIGAILRVTDFSGMKMNGDKLADEENVKKNALTEWEGFKVKSETSGTEEHNPPGDNGNQENDLGKMSMDDYIKARTKK